MKFLILAFLVTTFGCASPEYISVKRPKNTRAFSQASVNMPIGEWIETRDDESGVEMLCKRTR